MEIASPTIAVLVSGREQKNGNGGHLTEASIVTKIKGRPLIVAVVSRAFGFDNAALIKRDDAPCGLACVVPA